MLPTPDERFRGALIDVFRDFLSSVRILLEQKERRASETDARADERNHFEEIATLRQIADRLQAISSQQDSQHQGDERRYWTWSVVIQILLFLATTGAFGAAAWYAHIASQQKDTMEKQWTASTDTLKEIQGQTPLIRQSADASTRAAKAAGRSADVARDALVRAQRAFVSFAQTWTSNSVTTPADPQHITAWELRPVMINAGDTPTRNAIHRMNWQVMGTSLPVNFDFRDNTQGTPSVLFGLAPKGQISGATAQIPAVLLNQVHIHPDMFRVYFWGWARYQDVFIGTPEHITMFCWATTDVRSDPLAINTPLNYIGEECSNRHNCSDEECDGEHYGEGLIWHSRK
jgi:hypothetical protein